VFLHAVRKIRSFYDLRIARGANTLFVGGEEQKTTSNKKPRLLRQGYLFLYRMTD
jgi:hypothetical protein